MQGYSRPRLAVAAVAASAASLGGMAVGATAAHATTGSTISVDPNGATKTIAAGIAAAHSGDTVSVASGTYNETVNVPAGIHLMASGTAKVTGAINLTNAPGAVVEGFTITNVGAAAMTIKGSDNAIVRNNTITGSGKPSSFPSTSPAPGSDGTPAVVLSSAGSVLFTGNHVDNNVYHGIFVNGSGNAPTISGNEVSWSKDPNYRYAAGISVKEAGVTVTRNVSDNNDDSGIQFYLGGNNGVITDNVVYNNGDHGIDDLNVAGGAVVNNTVYNNATAGINVEGTSTGYTVENNISVDNGHAGLGRSQGQIRIANNATDSGPTASLIDHNLVDDSTSSTLYLYDWDQVNSGTVGGTNHTFTTSAAFAAGTGQGTHDKTGNPGFIGSSNFHIGASSPAAGLANVGAPDHPATDFDGNASNGSAGAYNSGSTGGGGGGGGGTATGPGVTRIAGDDRYKTGIALSNRAFPNAHTAPAVVLATGDNYPDALAGVPLAKKLGAPLLLMPTAGPNQLVTAEVNRVLKAGGTIYVLGGQAALPDTSLVGLTGTIQRISGQDRYDTAIRIAGQVAGGNPTKAVFATGTNFADALAAGPYAADVAGGGTVILLTNGTSMGSTGAYLTANGIHLTTAVAVGGPAVTAATAAGIPLTDSFKGNDRYETASMIAAKFNGEKTAGVAVGGASNKTQFADALTGAAYLANADGPLLLTANALLPSSTALALNGLAGTVGASGTIEIFGGTSAVSDGVVSAVISAVNGRAV